MVNKQPGTASVGEPSSHSREAMDRGHDTRASNFPTCPELMSALPRKRLKCCVVANNAIGQELTSTGVPTGIERQKRLVRYCRGYLRPSACVVPLNWP